MRVLAVCRTGGILAAACVSNAGTSTIKHDPGRTGRGPGELMVLVWDVG